MQASISFNLSEKKEILKYMHKEKTALICDNFINILSLDTEYIKKNIINKINYSDITSITNAYNEINNIQPLLLIDEFNIINDLDEYMDSSENIIHIEQSITQLKNLLQNSENLNNQYRYELKDAIKYLRKKRNIYLKLTNNIELIVKNTFKTILNLLNLYKRLVDICFIENTDNYFPGFLELPPLKKLVFYKMFVLKEHNFFDNLPSSNITFTFDCSTDEFEKKLKNNTNKNALNILFNENISPMYEYNCKSLEEFLQVSFFMSLTLNLNIKKCENCSKYFIAYQRNDEKYCNRISPQNKNKTCKQYANFENWKNNINSNEELKIYRRIYMAKQMQTRRNPDNLKLKENFENWKKEAQNIRNQYVHGKINKQEFLSWLNTNL